LGLLVPLLLARRRTVRPHLIVMCIGLFMVPPVLAQQEDDADRPTEGEAPEGTTLYVATVQGEDTRLPASDVVVETQAGTIVKIRVPGKVNGNIHSIAPHYGLPAPGQIIDLSRFRNFDAAQVKKTSNSSQAKTFVSKSSNSGTRAKMVHREIPNVNDQRLPGVDIIMKDKDGVVYKVRTPGRQQGDISTIAIHHEVPKVGTVSNLPPHAEPLHAIDGLENKDL